MRKKSASDASWQGHARLVLLTLVPATIQDIQIAGRVVVAEAAAFTLEAVVLALGSLCLVPIKVPALTLVKVLFDDLGRAPAPAQAASLHSRVKAQGGVKARMVRVP